MSFKRSEFNKIKANPNILHIPKETKFFLNEVDANNYKKTIKGTSTKHQWLMVLDDATEKEKKEIVKNLNASVEKTKQEQIKDYGKVLMNKHQEKLIYDVYSGSVDVWSVSFISHKTPQESIDEGTEYGTYDDEINGATPVMRK